jgi:hypothetical protein
VKEIALSDLYISENSLIVSIKMPLVVRNCEP